MTIDIHSSEGRGITKADWLESRHSFSFAEYHNPQKTNFGKLLVLNEDYIAPGFGFGMHPHANMEIITIVLQGMLYHEDSLGNKAKIIPGEIQRMSAGKGIIHSEINPGKRKTHLLQIWIEPEIKNINPDYEQKKITFQKNELLPIVSGTQNAPLYMHQKATLFLGLFMKGKSFNYALPKNQGVYCFVIDGKVKINNTTLKQGDAAAITEENIEGTSLEHSHILLFEVPL